MTSTTRVESSPKLRVIPLERTASFTDRLVSLHIPPPPQRLRKRALANVVRPLDARPGCLSAIQNFGRCIPLLLKEHGPWCVRDLAGRLVRRNHWFALFLLLRATPFAPLLAYSAAAEAGAFASLLVIMDYQVTYSSGTDRMCRLIQNAGGHLGFATLQKRLDSTQRSMPAAKQEMLRIFILKHANVLPTPLWRLTLAYLSFGDPLFANIVFFS